MSDTPKRDPSQWSPYHDRRGVPICAGDLIKTPHFTDTRRKRHYLYHVAVFEAGSWFMVPADWLAPSKKRDGGRCALSQRIVEASEVIHGNGPGDYLDYLDRPRVEAAAKGRADR